MAKPPFRRVDYEAEALGRVTDQLKDAEVFQKYLLTMLDGYADIQDCLEDLLQLRSLETAFGAQLDILGEIVGQPRILLEADLISYFGFQGYPSADSFGEMGEDVGGMFFDISGRVGENVRLNDTQYRMFIRAKIFKNSFTSTPEEFLTAINHIFQTDGTYISADGGGQATVFFSKELSVFERGLINYTFYGDNYPVRLVPKTVGVRINFGAFRRGEHFGFVGSEGARGFGSISPSGEHGVDCIAPQREDYGHILQLVTEQEDYGEILQSAVFFDDYNAELVCTPNPDGGVFAELLGIR